MGEGVTSPVRPHSAFDIRPVPHRMDCLIPVGLNKQTKKKGSTGKTNKKEMFKHIREILLADLLKDLAWGLPSDSFQLE